MPLDTFHRAMLPIGGLVLGDTLDDQSVENAPDARDAACCLDGRRFLMSILNASAQCHLSLSGIDGDLAGRSQSTAGDFALDLSRNSSILNGCDDHGGFLENEISI
jgi:hypothetical protein